MSLVDQIRAIERRLGGETVRSGAWHEDDDRFLVPSGFAEVDAALGGGLTRGALHEWFGVEESDEATKRRSHEATKPRNYSTWTPPLLLIVYVVKRTMSGDSSLRCAVWIGRRCFPYGGALHGTDGDRRLLERSLFVVVDRADDRLWAVDLALRCPAVGVVVADGSGFDMAATRRIQLVAKAHRTPAFLARPPWEVRELSAAQTRWLVRWERGTEAPRHEGTKGGEDESNVLNPRWSVELLRCKGGQPEYRPRVWALEWDRGQGALRVLTPLAGATGDAGTSTPTRRFRQA